jgi:hypothetical protein
MTYFYVALGLWVLYTLGGYTNLLILRKQVPWYQWLTAASGTVSTGALFYFLYLLVQANQQALTIVFQIFRMMGVPI